MKNVTQLKGLCLVFITLLVFTSSQAQQSPLFSSYINNPMLIGPSLAGSENSPNVGFISRLQFQGFEGSPLTNILLGEYSPDDKSYGLGVQFYADQIGIINNAGLQLNYSYNLKLSEDLNLGFGLGLGWDQWGFDVDRILVDEQVDPALIQSGQRVNTSRADFGAHLDYKNLLMAITVPRSLGTEFRFNSATNQELTSGQLREFVAFLQYQLSPSDKLKLTPSVMLRGANGIPMQYDINLLANYSNKLFAMASYRQGYAAALGGGIVLNKEYKLGYSYDLPVNGTVGYGTGAHEIFFNAKLPKLNR